MANFFSLQDGNITDPSTYGYSLTGAEVMNNTTGTMLLTSSLYSYNYSSDGSTLSAIAVHLSARAANPTGTLGLTLQRTASTGTFVDSSSSNLAITTVGSAYQNTFTPFNPNGWSGSFNGTTDYILTPTNSVLNLSGVAYTIEFWINPSTIAAGQRGIINLYVDGSGTTTGLNFYQDAANIRFNNGVVVGTGTATSNNPLSAGIWTHVALVSQNVNSHILYVNGVSAANYNNPLITASTNKAILGNWSTLNVAGYFNGYISNVRIIKGTALYTSNFTPSASPLTLLTNTLLLTLQDNRFKDNSTNNLTLTANGSVAIKDTSPFTPVAVDPVVHGGAGIFGASTYLSIPSNPSINIETSSNFTVEAWVYPTVNSATGAGYICTNRGAGNTGYGMAVITNNALQYYHTGGSTVTTTQLLSANRWYHVAATRSGTTCCLFINGIYQLSGTISNGGAGSVTYIGCDNTPNVNNFNGYISNLRVIKGTTLYTAGVNFTPSASPLTNISGTSLLLNTSNFGLQSSATETYAISSFTSYDGSNNLLTPYPQNWQILKLTNPLSTNRNDVINYTLSTSSPNQLSLMAAASAVDITNINTPYYTGTPFLTSIKPYINFNDSLYFKGTTDWLVVPANTNFNLSNDFTIECWFNSSHFAGTGQQTRLFNFGTNGLDAYFYTTAFSNILSIGLAGTTKITGTIPVANGIWHHIAVVKYNGVTKLFVDGVQSGSSYTTPITNLNNGVTNPLSIGAYNNSVNGQLSAAYLSNFRIVNGTAVYTTSAFTPPTTPLTNIPNTVFLMKNGSIYDQALITTSNMILTGSNVIANLSATSLSADSPFPSEIQQSLYFNGIANFSTVTNTIFPSSTLWRIGNTPVTLEWFIKPVPATQTALGFIWDSTNTTRNWFALNANLMPFIGKDAPITTATGTISAIPNSWNHIAFVIDSTTVKAYVNGKLSLNASFSVIVNTNPTFIIGYSRSAAAVELATIGAINSFRFTRSVLYPSEFTPPKSSFTPLLNTIICITPPYTSPSSLIYTSSVLCDDVHISSSLKGLTTESRTITADTYAFQNTLYVHNQGTLTFPLTSSKTLTMHGSAGLQITSDGTLNVGTSSAVVPLSTTHTINLSNTQIDVHNGGNLNVYGYPKLFTTNLSNDTVSGSRTFTTVDNISSIWKVGDTLTFKPNLTYRTGFDTLILSSFTGDNTFTTTSASVFTHTGSATYANIAGVYNLNRNVIIQGLNLTQRGTIRTIDAAKTSVNYAQLNNFGINSTNKTGFIFGNNSSGYTTLRGIVINSDNTSTVNNIAPLTGRSLQNTTIDNNIIYKSNTIAVSSLSVNNVTVSNNYILSSGGIALQMSNLSGSINMSNNTTIGSLSYGTYLFNNTLTGTYGANNFNSGLQGMMVSGTNTGTIVGGGLNSAKEGVYVDASTSNLSGLTFQNILANNNSSVGFKVSANSLNYLTPVVLNINGLVANTNLDNGFEGYNITGNLSSLTLNNNVSGGIRTSIGNGPTTFNGLTSILSGIPINILSGYNYSPTILKNTLLSSNSSVGIRLDSTRFSKFSLDNSTISASTPIQLNSTRNLMEGSYLFNNTYLGSINFIDLTKYQPSVSRSLGIGFTNYNKIAGNNFTYLQTGTKAIDTVIFDSTTSDQVSERLTPTSSTSKLRSSSKFVALNAGDTTVVRVNVLLTSDYTGNAPRLMLKRNPAAGIYDDTVLSLFSLLDRDAFSVLIGSSANIPKVVDNCVLEFYVDCDGTTGYVCVDTWSAN